MDNGASSYHRFLNGDESGFDEIIHLYRENLIFFINRYVGNYYTAEDLAEDAFLELLLHPKRYDFKRSLKTYLFTIARNKAVDYIRHNKRLIQFSADPKETGAFSSVEDKYLINEKHRELHKALNSLKADYKTAIHLVFFEDMSNEEAAAVMRKNKKQVENLLYRAKLSLRTILEKEKGYNHEGF